MNDTVEFDINLLLIVEFLFDIENNNDQGQMF